MNDDNSKDNILKFPNGEDADLTPSQDFNEEDIDNEMSGIVPVVSEEEGPRVLTDVDEDKSLDELIKDITDAEVKRLYKNLDFLDSLEMSVKDEVKRRMELGTLTLENLLTIMDAFGKSVDRSNKIIKDKNSPLLNVFIDNRQQTQIDNVSIESGSETDMLKQLDRSGRKKITNMLSAFIAAAQQTESEHNNEN